MRTEHLGNGIVVVHLDREIDNSTASLLRESVILVARSASRPDGSWIWTG
ncbi:hypothetical protein [Actinomadura sp. 7K507]|nr:hypothetical protein [Actinomadura sp. 7K507]